MVANARSYSGRFSVSKKLAFGDLFRQNRFYRTFGAAVKTCKETLLCKASDLTAHVAEVGLAIGGLAPFDTSQGVDRHSETPGATHYVCLQGIPIF